METTTPSLFERIGGEAAIEAAVVTFYEKVMADPTLAHFFVHLEMGAQIKKQIAFMTMAFGGPSGYTGKDLRTAHAKLVKERGLNDAHFDSISVHLRETLEELGVDEGTNSEVIAAIGATRNDVLDR